MIRETDAEYKKILSISMKGKLAIEKLLLIIPNRLEWIVDLERYAKYYWRVKKYGDWKELHWNLKKNGLVSTSMSVCKSNNIKGWKKPRNDLEVKFILKNDECEYDEFRKKFAKSKMGNKGVKNELVKRAKKFIHGKALKSAKLFTIFGLD